MTIAPAPEDGVQVLVVGAGPVGLLTALELANKGVSVRLVDKAFGAAPHPHVGELLQRTDSNANKAILRYSLAQWRTLEERHNVETGMASRGAMELSTSPGRTFILEQESTEDIAQGEISEMLESEGVEEKLETKTGLSVTGGRWMPEIPTIAVTTAIENLRQAVVRAGVMVWGEDTVASLIVENDQVLGIRTSSGEECRANTTILTGGTTAPALLETAGVRLPLRPARNHLLTLAPKEDIGYSLIAHRLRHGFMMLKRTREDHILLSYDGLADPTQATYSFQPDVKLINALRQHAGQLLPALEGAELVATTVITTMVTPDYQPALGPWTGRPGLYIAVGFADRSLAWAAGIAQLICQNICEEMPSVDMGDLIPQRFAIGMWQKVKGPKALDWPEGDELNSRRIQLVSTGVVHALSHDIQLVGKTIQRPSMNAGVQQVGKTITRAEAIVQEPVKQERQKIGRFQTAPIAPF